MGDEERERQEIEAYLDQHHLQAFLGDTVNDVVKQRPTDPLVKLAEALMACSDSSRQIQSVHGRQILNGEALPALEVEIRTCQGSFYGAVSRGPYDEEDHYEGKGVLRAVESVDTVLAEIIEGKDPTQQAKLDKMLAMEVSLPKNTVLAASIACCKAGAKQAAISVFDHVVVMSNNGEAGLPAPGFSIINGGHLSSSSLWVQDIIIMPTEDLNTFADRLMVASTVHRTLEEFSRNAGQEALQRGPRGGFCNGAGTFDQLMGCLVAALDAAGYLGKIEIVIDVHASKLVPRREGEEVATKDGGEEKSITYDLATFKSDKGGVDLTPTAEGLLEIYLEWLEKYPITAFIEPFAPADIVHSRELLNRGHEVLQNKAQSPIGEGTAAPQAANEGEGGGEGGTGGAKDSSRLKVIADESVLTPVQLGSVNEQRGANAVLINIAKMSTVWESIALAAKANEVGWTVIVGASSEDELDGQFMTDLAVGLRADNLFMSGLRSVAAVASCAHLARIEGMGVNFVGMPQQ